MAWIGPGTSASVLADLGQRGFRPLAPDAVRAHDPDRLRVAPETTARDLAGAAGADWAVWGSYQRMGSRLRLTGYAYDLSATAEIHTVRAEGPRETLFELQDELVDQLVGYMQPSTAASDSPPPVRAAGLALPAVRAIHGPAPPDPPAVIRRSNEGRATVRAVRVDGLSIDGVLDEAVYDEIASISDFIMQEPQEGPPATERTEVWVLFNDDNIFVSARCWNSAPESEWIVNEMRRDSFNVSNGEFVGLLFDTFYDRRSGINLGINPIGGRVDAQMTDERNFNMDWNPVWELQTGRFEGGWTFELAFPFKSLRYRPGRTQVWGFNMMRNVQWKNERSFLVRMPNALGQAAMMMASLAATVVGIEVPASTQSLEIKPYVITDLSSDRRSTPPVSNEWAGDVGLDVKYGVTQNLVADLTVNPDFAQVEADEQQVNLTRFSLFFPEKREFFLENQGVFNFGGAGAGPFGGSGDTPVLFYSRRIGLESGREVPISAGGKLTGRVGAFSVGALTIQSNDEPVSGTPKTNFSIVRFRRDLLRRSSVGALFARRSTSIEAIGPNETYGVDGAFGFYDNLTINTYWARTETAGFDDDTSYRGQFDYNGDRYGLQVERLAVGADFNPEVGFLRRRDFERSFGFGRFSPRLPSVAAIRKISFEGHLDYVEDRAGLLETREAQGQFGVEFENSDELSAAYTSSYEFLKRPFQIARGVTIPIGAYRFDDFRATAGLGAQHRLAGTFAFQHGGFFGGDRTSLDFRRGRLEITRQLSVDPGFSFNWIDLPQGSFTSELVTTRTTYTVTPLMFVSALLQYNSSNDSFSTNVRLRWEYQPGSELFIVYNEQRDTLAPSFPELENRAFVVKINRLWRF